jgi:hypothetical protein
MVVNGNYFFDKQPNMKHFFLLFLFFISLTNFVSAQSEEGKANRNQNQGSIPHALDPLAYARSTGTSGTGANIDVIYHKIFWRINPDSAAGKYIKGSVQFNFKTTQANVNTISFDIRSVLTIDSVTFRGAALLPASIVRVGNIATITLTATLANNFIDSFTVFYRGVPPAVSGAAQGYQLYADANAGNVINTLSESYEDRDWWPCKHDMQDKIDSMDIYVSVPWGSVGAISFPLVSDTFWVATNGRMVDSSIVGNSRIFRFKSNYAIASYLVFVNVARFERYYRTVLINGTTNVPVVYNLLRGNTTRNANAVVAMDKVNAVLQEWSKRFGPYPFKLDKHGFADGLQGAGGMEHQTMSSMVSSSLSSVSILTHELTHQWFGDNVTFAHWNDLWLAEGFAEYSLPLSQELIPSIGTAASAYTSRNSLKNGASGALALSAQSAWIPNASSGNSNLIWSSNYGSTVYQRGAMIVSMLRTMCGDSIFFSALTKYQTDLATKSATTDTLRNYFNRELGRDISVFFDDYVGGSDTSSITKGGVGNPINTVSWNSVVNETGIARRLVVSVTSQAKTAGSNVSYFRGPIQLHIKGALPANDTTITLFDWGGGNLSYAGRGIGLPIAGNRLTYDLSFIPTTVLYDDSARTMSSGTGTGNKTGTTKLTTLSSYVWLGTTNTAWNTATNWQTNPGLPPSGADITISTTGGINQPVLPANTTVGPLTINGTNKLVLNGFTLTLNNAVRSTGTITGSPTSNIVVMDQAATLNFDQTSSATRSLNTLTLNPSTSATVGTGLLEIYGGLILPLKSNLNVKSANMLIR